MPDSAWEVHGVTVTHTQLASGPVWQWDTDAFGGVVLHHEIQWVQGSRSWVRRTAITDPHAAGGWNAYPADYDKAHDVETAAQIVHDLLERELGP